MKKRILLIGCLMAAGIGSAAAQELGRIINTPIFGSSQRLLLSQNDYIYGTSRTTAMGGAFTSLGADLSSMNINPAGLGMYQSSDWGITQSLSINTMTTTGNQAASLLSGGNRTSYGLDNVAIAWNVLNRSSGLTSFTFGLGYNRTANFNSRSYTHTQGEKVSAGDMFFQQLDVLDADGFGQSALESSQRPFENLDIGLRYWGAILGYQTGLIGKNNGGGYVNYFNDATRVDSYMESITKGGLYEYTFSMGANINNILYLGATLGLTQVNYHEDLAYDEIYSNNPGNFNQMRFNQYTDISGAGFTMKLGAIVRPIPSLRLGVAFHLPTYYSLEKTYYGNMSVSGTSRSTGDMIDNGLKLNSAPRLLTGVSYIIADRAILSVDYERAWYNKTRMRGDMWAVENSKADSKSLYKPSNTIRAGMEILASDIVSVRAGGAYSMDFMTDDWVMDTPTVKSYYSISGGLGFNIGRNAYVDVTYLFNRAQYTKYELFYFDDAVVGWAHQYDNASLYDPELAPAHRPVARNYTPRKNMHRISLTIGSRF